MDAKCVIIQRVSYDHQSAIHSAAGRIAAARRVQGSCRCHHRQPARGVGARQRPPRCRGARRRAACAVVRRGLLCAGTASAVHLRHRLPVGPLLRARRLVDVHIPRVALAFRRCAAALSRPVRRSRRQDHGCHECTARGVAGGGQRDSAAACPCAARQCGPLGQRPLPGELQCSAGFHRPDTLLRCGGGRCSVQR